VVRALVGVVGVIGAVVAVALSTGCSSDRAGCDQLAAELAELTPTAADAWEDITVLQESIPRVLELDAEIAERCS
jgi:outer membrane murein-binding lipoprotein Lpp